jgi:hypothetical protein
LDRLDLFVGEAPLPLKISVAWLGEPWRHIAPLGDQNNLRRVLAHVVVREQGERAGLSRTVARCARMVNYRRNLLVEGDGLGRCSRDSRRMYASQPVHDQAQ